MTALAVLPSPEESTPHPPLGKQYECSGGALYQEPYRLQRIAAAILFEAEGERGKQHRTCTCSRVPIFAGSSIDLWHSASRQRAYYSKLLLCGLVWTCPVCAVRISARRRSVIEAGITRWEGQGGAILLATLTVTHRRRDDLQPLLSRLLDSKNPKGALPSMQEHGAYKRMKPKYGVAGQIRAIHVTWNKQNGWHPHIHMAYLMNRHPSDSDLHAFTRDLREQWGRAVLHVGLRVDDDHGLTVERRRPSMASYLTKGHLRQGHDGKLTPWDLLRWKSAAKTPQEGKQAVALFREYAAAFKGRQQIRWSPDELKEQLGVTDASDAELARLPDDTEYLMTIPREVWRDVRKAHAIGEVRAAASTGDVREVARLIASLTARASAS